MKNSLIVVFVFFIQITNQQLNSNQKLRKMPQEVQSLDISRVYSHINIDKPEIDSDPVFQEFEDGFDDDYESEEEIGSGAFSHVYVGRHLPSNEKVVLKRIEKAKKKTINREIAILNQLRGKSKYIVEMYDAIRNQEINNATIVYNISLKIDLEEIKMYHYQLLIALDVGHSNGIMHRDLKLGNIIVDHENKQLQLIDWGLAEYYRPRKEYSTRPGTRYYKAPELLVGYKKYDYSVDMWSFGCVFASVIFRRTPFFKGKDNQDQLVKITKILGTKEFDEYLDKYDIEIDTDLDYMIEKHRKKPWTSFINEKNQHLCTDDALDLISKILVYDHRERLTAKEAMEHPFFDSIR